MCGSQGNVVIFVHAVQFTSYLKTLCLWLLADGMLVTSWHIKAIFSVIYLNVMLNYYLYVV